MPWTGLGTDQFPAGADVEDAVNNKHLQLSSLTGVPAYTAAKWWHCAEFETYIRGAGDLGTDSQYPTRAQVETWRRWHPGTTSDIPGAFSGSSGGLGGYSMLTWTDDADIPSWAHSSIEVVVYKCTGSSCTPSTTPLAAVNYGTGSYTDTSVTNGTTYGYRLRYRSKYDASWLGPLTSTIYVTSSGGGGGA